MSKPRHLIIALLYRRSQEVVKENREEGVDTERLSTEEKKKEIRGGSRKERREK